MQVVDAAGCRGIAIGCNTQLSACLDLGAGFKGDLWRVEYCSPYIVDNEGAGGYLTRCLAIVGAARANIGSDLWIAARTITQLNLGRFCDGDWDVVKIQVVAFYLTQGIQFAE